MNDDIDRQVESLPPPRCGLSRTKPRACIECGRAINECSRGHYVPACFITVRAFQHDAPFNTGDLNDVVVDVLLAERLRSACLVYALCLMPDHLHVLAAPKVEGASVLAFVDRFKGRSTNASWQLVGKGRLWQPRSYDHVLRREESILSVCEYILANPVRRGSVEYPEEYRWSGLVDRWD